MKRPLFTGLVAAAAGLAASGAFLPTPARAGSPDSSAVIRAMDAEWRRSVDSLSLRGGAPPYFISYLLWDVRSYQMQASCGSVEISGFDRQHYLNVDLRVGDYGTDNSNFQGGLVFGPRLQAPLPQDNDTNLIRLALWAATDARYKVALEQIAQKRAFLSAHSDQRRLPDFSRPPPVRQVGGDAAAPPDTAAIAALGRDLSGHLSAYPWLSESRVGYQYYFTTFYYVDSDGSAYVQTMREYTLIVSLLTQAEDGAPLWDYLRLSFRDPLDVGKGKRAGLDSLKAALRPILSRLEYLRKAEPLANYRGPVLLSGPAAGELLYKALLWPQARMRETLGAMSEPNFLLSLRGRRLFPPGIEVGDAPSRRERDGRALFGHYLFDHQGQPARDLILIQDGRVRDFFLGKVPVLDAKGHTGNGHWRYGGGFPGVVELRSARPSDEAELRTKLAALGSDEGNGYGLIVSKGMDEDAFKLLRHPLAAHLAMGEAPGGGGSFSLSPPCEIDRIGPDGNLIPVRGPAFPAIDSKSLRDIAAVGGDPHLYEPQAAFTVLCPSLLFSLLDMKGPRGTWPRLPYLP